MKRPNNVCPTPSPIMILITYEAFLDLREADVSGITLSNGSVHIPNAEDLQDCQKEQK